MRTVLGISNVSFGLPAGRARSRQFRFPLLLHQGRPRSRHRQCRAHRALPFHPRTRTQAGRRPSLQSRPTRRFPTTHPQAALLRGAPADWREQSREQKAAINQFHIAAIAEHFRGAGTRKKARPEDLPLDQRLANYILEGSKDGLIADLDSSSPKASRRSTSSTARSWPEWPKWAACSTTTS